MKHCTLIFICVNAFFLTSCGIKPADVEPPKGAKHDNFPKTYPDPNTDPLNHDLDNE